MVGGTTGSHVNPAIFPNVIGGRMWMNRDTFVINGVGAQPARLFLRRHLGLRGEQVIEWFLSASQPATAATCFVTASTVSTSLVDKWDLIGAGANLL